MTSRNERDQQLHQQINRVVLADPDSATRYHTDAAVHLQVEVLRNVLLLADKAMEVEGIDREARDRIVHWILTGTPPPDREEDPDARVEWASLTQHMDNLPAPDEIAALFAQANDRPHHMATEYAAPARPPRRFTVLVASTHRECDRWCYENQRSRQDPLIIRITNPSDIHRLQGIVDFDDLVVISAARNHTQVMAEVRARMSRHGKDPV